MFMKLLIALATFGAVTAVTAAVSAFFTGYSDPADGVYDVWANPGLHLMMSDNGTPDDFDDDFVIDWETNREIVVFVLDK